MNAGAGVRVSPRGPLMIVDPITVNAVLLSAGKTITLTACVGLISLRAWIQHGPPLAPELRLILSKHDEASGFIHVS